MSLYTLLQDESFAKLIPQDEKESAVDELLEQNFRSFNILCGSDVFILSLSNRYQQKVFFNLAATNHIERCVSLIKIGVKPSKNFLEIERYSDDLKSRISWELFRKNVLAPNVVLVDRFCARFEPTIKSTYKILHADNNLREDVIIHMLEFCDIKTLNNISLTSKDKPEIYKKEPMKELLHLYTNAKARPSSFTNKCLEKIES